jgi:hypothetical protein
MRDMRSEVLSGSKVSVNGQSPLLVGHRSGTKEPGSKELEPSRHPIIAFAIGTLIALAIIAGMIALLAHQQ